MSDNEDRFEAIKTSVEALGLDVSEEDLNADIDVISNVAGDTFWDEMYHSDDYDSACESVEESIGDQLEELSYFTERLEEPGWEDSENYDTFRELLQEEVFDRANIPVDENEARERMEEDDNEFEDSDFDELD